jgi:hypothetical protein
MGIIRMFHFSNWFLGHKLLHREHVVNWNTVMVETPIIGAKFRTFSSAQLHVSLQYFHIISFTDSLALCNEFKGNNTLHIEESDEHCLHLWFWYAALFEPLMPFKITWSFHSFSPTSLGERLTSITYIIL